MIGNTDIQIIIEAFKQSVERKKKHLALIILENES